MVITPLSPDASTEMRQGRVVEQRAADLFRADLRSLHVRMDRLFCKLLVFQWMCGIAMALFLTPWSWEGNAARLHLHVKLAIFFEGAVIALPLVLARRFPGSTLTRHAIAASQMVTSALIIHFSGGRIESHFHVFGSLAFLAAYRDWAILLNATTLVTLDHVVRGIFFPESVFGVLSANVTRTVEHSGWVLFEDAFLLLTIEMSRKDMRRSACQQAELELTNDRVEAEVVGRTRELQMAQRGLAHAERMASIGQLSAGIAHEINTPVQFVGDNVRASVEMLRDLKRYVQACRTFAVGLQDDPAHGSQARELRSLDEELDVAFLLQDVPAALIQSQEGLDRIRRIVRAMKQFSHNGRVSEYVTFDVNAGLRSTLIVATNELKYSATIETEFGDLPMIEASPGAINQVFLNLLINAAHAIQDRGERGTLGTITVRTWSDEGSVFISVADSGCGMSKSLIRKIFDPFFTTKEVGRGTGQGLTISHAIVKDHRGNLAVTSEEGVGSTFTVELPIRGAGRTNTVSDAQSDGLIGGSPCPADQS